MSPTLLELVVTAFVLVIAWLIGAWVAPRLVALFVSFWRGPGPSPRGIAPPETSSPPANARFLPPK